MRLMMMAFSLMLTAGATAQSTGETQRADGPSDMAMRPHRMKRLTQEQMTQKMIDELKLDEKQTQKVTKLNKKFKKLIEGEQPDNMKGQRPPMGQGRPGGNRGGGGMHGGGFGGMGGPGGGFGGGMGGPGGMPPGGGSQQASYDYDKQQEKYDKKIRKLLTDNQYESYLKLKPEFHSQRRVREFLWGGEMNMPDFQ